jgi:hypothetical protein
MAHLDTSEAIYTIRLKDLPADAVEGPLTPEAKAAFVPYPTGPALPVTPFATKRRTEGLPPGPGTR